MTADLPLPPHLTGARRLQVADSHTCGQPTRVVLTGHGIAPGTAPRDGQAQLRDHADWLRRVVVTEPRGHRSMFGVVPIAPLTPGGDWGLVFMDAATYPDMCGHATIGTATTLIELGLIPLPHPGFSGQMPLTFATPAGPVALRVTVEGGRCSAVTFTFEGARHDRSLMLDLPGIGPVPVDIAFAGQWYAYLPVSASGLRVEAAAIGGLIHAAEDVRRRLADHLSRLDPAAPKVGNIVWIDSPRHPQAHHRNVPVSAAGSFDRSPCGTATCARMATLVAKGHLTPDAPFVNEGLLGTLYHGRAEAFSDDKGPAIRAHVQGSAWLTALSTLIVDPADPLGEGYLA